MEPNCRLSLLQPDDERSIVYAAQAGDQAAFGRLVDVYRVRAEQAAWKFVKNSETAADLVQDAFVNAYTSLSSFDPQFAFYPWFYKILKNLCLNWIKAEKRRRNQSMEELESEQYVQFADEATADAREQVSTTEDRDRLWQGIDQLTPVLREAVIMHYFHNLTYSEVAEALGVPIGTVMSRLHNARIALRDFLKE